MKQNTTAYAAGRSARAAGRPKLDAKTAGDLRTRNDWLAGWMDEDTRRQNDAKS